MENNVINGDKVYGMLLEVKDVFFLSIQYAKSLEQAINQAKLEFFRINPPVDKNQIIGFKVELFTVKNVNDLVKEKNTYSDKLLIQTAEKHRKVENKEEIKKPVEVKKVLFNPVEMKNIIMKEIITKKDKNLLEVHKELFTENEKKYLIEKINKKTK